MEKKLEIINEMVKNGYCLVNRTAEQMATLFTIEQLETFYRVFNEHKASK